MIRFALFVAASLLAIGWMGSARADLIPTPDFSNHAIPTDVPPSTDAVLWTYLDIGLLALALTLATYFAHVSRSRRRLLALTVASLLWFGFVRGGCVCAIGATQNVALAVCQPSYVAPIAVVAFFTLPLVYTLFFGRTFCAAVCPLGAAQELVAVRTIRVPGWLDQALGLLAYIYLGAAVLLAATGTAFVICRFDPFVGFFRLSGSTSMLVFGACLLLLGVFVGRPYCRYLCPYGAILRLLSPLTKWHVRIPPDRCIQCRLCEDACPYDAIRSPTKATTGTERERRKRQFLGSLALAPVLVALGAWTGGFLGGPLAGWHPDVRLARQLRLEDLERTQVTTKASEAFRVAQQAPEDAYRVAARMEKRFGGLGFGLGAWVGLVIAAKLIQLTLLRKRADFEPDRSGCVSCGRCYWYCPAEQVRRGLVTDIVELVPESKS